MTLQNYSTRLHERSIDGCKLVRNREAVLPLLRHSYYCVQVTSRRMKSYHHVMVHCHSSPLNDSLMMGES